MSQSHLLKRLFFSLLNCIPLHPVANQLTINVRTYFWILSPAPLIYMSTRSFFFLTALLFIIGCSGSLLFCMGFFLQRLLLLRGKGYRHAGFSSWGLQAWLLPACGIFLDPGSNPCPLCWKVDSYPLYHQGSPYLYCLDYWSFAVEIEIWRFEIDKCEFCSFFFSPQH